MLYEQMLAARNGSLSATALEGARSPMSLGFYTTLVLQGAEESLARGTRLPSGVTVGPALELHQLAADEIGADAARAYGLG